MARPSATAGIARPTKRLYGRDCWYCEAYTPTLTQLRELTALSLLLLGEPPPPNALEATVMIERLRIAVEEMGVTPAAASDDIPF